MSRRGRIADLLRSSSDPLTAREISLNLGIPEPTVARDLVHIAKSLRGKGETLMMAPASCLGCGHVFDTPRTTVPGKCPSCRSLWIQPPAFAIQTCR